MKYDNWKQWLFDTLIRTVKTMAEAAVGIIITSKVIYDVDWKMVLGTVAIAGVTCMLLNIKNLPNPFEPKQLEEVKQEEQNG